MEEKQVTVTQKGTGIENGTLFPSALLGTGGREALVG